MRSLPFKRKRKGITNFRKRLITLKGKMSRAVVRKSLKNITIQIVEFGRQGDKVVLSADSKELKKYGWKVNSGNLPAAYLTGYLLGQKAKQKKISEAILDIGLHVSTKGARIYAALKGMVDGGLKIPHNAEILPSPDRLNGKHIQTYAQTLQKEDKEKYQNLFSGYLKAGVDPTAMEKLITQAKERISKEGAHHG